MNLAVKINTAPATIQVQLGENRYRTLADTWNNREPLCLLGLYGQGIRLATLGKWLGVNKRTVWRRLGKLRAVAARGLGLGAGACSGQIGIDETWMRSAGAWPYRLVAVDLETHRPLHFAI